MSPQSTLAAARRNLDAIALVISLLSALGFTVLSPFQRLANVEREVARISIYARAAAVDLCLSRPDSTLARMQLDCAAILKGQ